MLGLIKAERDYKPKELQTEEQAGVRGRGGWWGGFSHDVVLRMSDQGAGM